jgi:hypothetical protein
VHCPLVKRVFTGQFPLIIGLGAGTTAGAAATLGADFCAVAIATTAAVSCADCAAAATAAAFFDEMYQITIIITKTLIMPTNIAAIVYVSINSSRYIYSKIISGAMCKIESAQLIII